MKVLLVSPLTPDTFWSFKHALPFVSKRAACPPLGLLTVAGMLPREWDCRLVDLNVSRLHDADLDWADYVMSARMLVHRESVLEIVARCRAAGKPVIAGGPLFTPSDMEPSSPTSILRARRGGGADRPAGRGHAAGTLAARLPGRALPVARHARRSRAGT